MFGQIFQKIVKTISTKQLNPSTSSFHVPLTTESHASRGFPSPNPPPRPRPYLSCTSTAALASRSRSTTASWPLAAAQCSGVSPREPRTRGQAAGQNPHGTKGRKSLRKFWAPQKSKFWKLWPLKILPGLKEHYALDF